LQVFSESVFPHTMSLVVERSISPPSPKVEPEWR
jgi:hypothetical protein